MDFYREWDHTTLQSLLSTLLTGLSVHVLTVCFQFSALELCRYHALPTDDAWTFSLNLSSDSMYLLKDGVRTFPEEATVEHQRADLVKHLLGVEITSVLLAENGQLTLHFTSDLSLVVPIEVRYGPCDPSWVLLEEGGSKSDFGDFNSWYIGSDIDGVFGNLKKSHPHEITQT